MFYGKIWLSIPKLSLLPLLICSTDADTIFSSSSHSLWIFRPIRLNKYIGHALSGVVKPVTPFGKANTQSTRLDAPFTHSILADSSFVICWMSPFVISGVSSLFCHFYSILLENPVSKQCRP